MYSRNLLKICLIFILCLLSSYTFSQQNTQRNTQQSTSSDADITANVKGKMASASSSPSKVEVSTANGVVTLTGEVDSNTQASTLTEIAQSTPGVKDVDTSNLTVTDSKQPMTDAYITAKVKGKFIQEKLFGDKDIAAINIKVETNNGVTSLSGMADNPEQANNAVKIAKTVKGVKKVKSTIQVSGNNNNNKS